ncbi:hypothetical protein, partial [uncultured Cobetia sp.]|uniref:hypothetical protein n=1 Tax=uncultured Cobetia sp. TaxID=410706 RepID=UPI00259A433B
YPRALSRLLALKGAGLGIQAILQHLISLLAPLLEPFVRALLTERLRAALFATGTKHQKAHSSGTTTLPLYTLHVTDRGILVQVFLSPP